MDDTIKQLQLKLDEIRLDAAMATTQVAVLQATIAELKAGNSQLKSDILALQETNKQAVKEFEKALNAEKRKGWKKLFWGALGGLAVGIVVGAAVAQ